MERAAKTQPPPPRHLRPRTPPRPGGRIAACLACLIVGVGGFESARAVDIEESANRRTLVEAVEAAATVDLYHARCRGDVSGRRMENLNQLLVSKLRLTVLTVQDDFFPERSYRRVERRLEADFAAALMAAGGCQGAKESTLPEHWKARYEAALAAVRALP